MRSVVFFLVFLMASIALSAAQPNDYPNGITAPQIAVGKRSLTSGASLDLSDSTRATLLNRGTTSQRNGITPTKGMLYYNFDTSQLEQYNGTQWTGMAGSEFNVGNISDVIVVSKGTTGKDIQGTRILLRDSAGADPIISVLDSNNTNYYGSLTIKSSDFAGSSKNGGDLTIQAGRASTVAPSDRGGNVVLKAGHGASYSTAGNVVVEGGSASDFGVPGNITVTPGKHTVSGNYGYIDLFNSNWLLHKTHSQTKVPIRLMDEGTNYVGLSAPSDVTSSYSLTLPDAAPSDGAILAHDTDGALSWSTVVNRSFLSAGTADHVLINDGSGSLSSETTLAKSRGGTGADNSSVTFPASGTIATLAGSEAFTNKDIDGGGASDTSRITLPKATYSELESLTNKEGMIAYATDRQKPYFNTGDIWKPVGSGSGSGSVNFLTDPNLEAPGLPDWTLTSGVEFEIDDEESLGPNVTTVCFDWEGSANSVIEQLVSVSADGLGYSNLDKVNLEHSIWVKANFEGLNVNALHKQGVGGATVVNSIPVPGDFKWGDPIRVTSVGNALVTEVGINVKPTNSNTGKVCVAKARVGPNEGVGTATEVTSWQSFMPVWGGSGSNPSIGNGSIKGYLRRVGDSADIRIDIISGTTTSYGTGVYTFSLPPDLKIDRSKTNDTYGIADMYKNAAPFNSYIGRVIYGTDTSVRVIGTSVTLWGLNVPVSLGSEVGNTITLTFTVPIVGWNASSQVTRVGQGADLLGDITSTPLPECGAGKLKANGQAVSRTVYSALFNKYGTKFGPGDGSTTFNLPNMNALVLRGTGTQAINGLTKTGPTNPGDKQEDKMQGHKHGADPLSDGNIVMGGSGGSAAGLSAGGSAYRVYPGVGGPLADGYGTPRTGPETQVASMGVTWCVVASHSYQQHIAQAVTTKYDGMTNLAWVKSNGACTSDPCPIKNQSGNVSSIDRISAGEYKINYSGFSIEPTCVCSIYGGSNDQCKLKSEEGLTSVSIFTGYVLDGVPGGMQPRDGNFRLICTGPK